MSGLLQGLCLKLGLDLFLQYSSKPMAGATTKSASEPTTGTPYKNASEPKAGVEVLQNFAFVFEPMPIKTLFPSCGASNAVRPKALPGLSFMFLLFFLSELLFKQSLSPQANWVVGG